MNEDVKLTNSTEEETMKKTKLREYLDAHGIKQKFIAEKVGISNRQMSYLVNEATTIKIDLLNRIAKVLNCNVEDIVEGYN